jgi:hypothetical protein
VHPVPDPMVLSSIGLIQKVIFLFVNGCDMICQPTFQANLINWFYWISFSVVCDHVGINGRCYV